MEFAVHVVTPRGYGHSGAFMEIAETLHHALRALGHGSILLADPFDAPPAPGRQVIVLGGNLLLPRQERHVGGDAIVYNFEQVGPDSEWFAPAYLRLLSRCEVWDYSQNNTAALRRRGIDARHVPLGWRPELERVQKTPPEFDVLFYGTLNERRERILLRLEARGLVVKRLFGVYGAERDAQIAKAKLVLNLHYYEAQVFEIPRVSYLLGNGICVVSEAGVDPLEREFADAVEFAPYPLLVDSCVKLAGDEGLRLALGERGQKVMRARREETYLEEALANERND